MLRSSLFCSCALTAASLWEKLAALLQASAQKATLGQSPLPRKVATEPMQDGSEVNIAGVRTGDVLVGKYRILQVLGVGGMGVVVAAQHLQLDQRVAIKFLLPEALKNPEVVERFVREARAAVKIRSEFVARVSDVGALENGAPYMVMEYLEGSDLAAWIQQRGALAIEQAAEFLLHACEAIADAHAQGIIHRDLKPANLFCIRRSDGLLAVKVLDFGISKVSAVAGVRQEAGITKTSAVFGSPLYMSPEQMLSARDVDARTDIWALGIILYELVTARSPFEGETMAEIFARVATQPPPPLRNARPDAPLALEAVILKCLEKDRTKRYPNVAELAKALIPFAPKRAHASAERASRVIQAAGLSATALAPPSSSETSPASAVSGTSAAWGNTGPATKSRSRILLSVTLTTTLALVAAGAVFLFNKSDHAKPTTALAAPRLATSLSTATTASGNEARPDLPEVTPASKATAVITSAVMPSAVASVTAHTPPTAKPPRRTTEQAKASVTKANQIPSVLPPQAPGTPTKSFLDLQY